MPSRQYIHELRKKIYFLMETNNCEAKLGKFAEFIGVPRKTLSDSIEAEGLSPEIQSKLACTCSFRLDWLEWIDPGADKKTLDENRTDTFRLFRVKYQEEKRKLGELNLLTIEKQVPLLQPVRSSPPIATDNMLASLQILVSQFGPGEPCPVTFELSCFTIPLDDTTLAVQRGKVQFSCSNASASSLGERNKKSELIDQKQESWDIKSGGNDSSPFWIIETRENEIGVVSLPHDLFNLYNLSDGDTITAQFSIYVKDLEITHDDPKEDLPAYALIRPGHKGLGIARSKILKRLAAMSLPGGDDGWLILCSDEISFRKAVS